MNQLRHLIPLVEQLDSATVACVGDLMLDTFIHDSVTRVSPEAPIPVLNVDSQVAMLGGMGNVVRNLAALGCGIKAFSVIGEDGAEREIEEMMRSIPRCQISLPAEAGRKTPVKVGYIADGQQLLCADYEAEQVISDSSLKLLLDRFEETLLECSVVILSDYAKGTLAGPIAAEFIRIAVRVGKAVIVDPKGRDYSRYRGATAIKPNLKELAEASAMPVHSVAAQEKAARRLIEQTHALFILVTRGPEGMLLVPSDGPPVEFASRAREVFDVSGAGDTVASALAASSGSGVSLEDAVGIANIAAVIAVGKAGTAVVSRQDIVHEIEQASALAASDKVLRTDEALERVHNWRRMGLRIGFVFGSFDILSTRQLMFLEKARAECDRLVVALQNDPMSVRGGRAEAAAVCSSRAYSVACLVFSDAVIICEDQTSDRLLMAFRPDLVSMLPNADPDAGFAGVLN